MVLCWPEHESVIVEAGRCIGALLVLLLGTLGYVQAEASVDLARAPADEPSNGSLD